MALPWVPQEGQSAETVHIVTLQTRLVSDGVIYALKVHALL